MSVCGVQYRPREEEGRYARELHVDRGGGVFEGGAEVAAGGGCFALRYPYA